jgi:N-acetylneuraminic acid mutarotase
MLYDGVQYPCAQRAHEFHFCRLATHARLSVLYAAASDMRSAQAIVFGAGYDDSQPKGKGYSAAWEMLNVTTGEWSTGTLPSGVARQYGTAVGCGGKVLIAGGQPGGGRSDAVDIFDSATQKWSNATLTVARSNLAAACASDRFAVIAGGQIPGRTTVDVLDTKTGEWGTLEPLNFGRGWLVGAGAGDCVVFGSGPGVKAESGAASVDEYCFAAGN